MALAPALTLTQTLTQTQASFFILSLCTSTQNYHITMNIVIRMCTYNYIIIFGYKDGGAKHCFGAILFVCVRVCQKLKQENGSVHDSPSLNTDYYKQSICWFMVCLVYSKLFYLYFCCLSSHFSFLIGFFLRSFDILLLIHSIIRE